MTREKAIEMCKSIKDYLTGGNPVWSKEEVAEAMTMAINALEVDLVLCKECKYAHVTYGGECKYCDNWSLEDPLYLAGDFFCAYGERRSDD